MRVSTLISATTVAVCAVQAHVIGARDGLPTPSLPIALPTPSTSGLPLPAAPSMSKTDTPAPSSLPAVPARRALLPVLHAHDLPLAIHIAVNDHELHMTDKLDKLTSTVDDIEQKLKPAKPFRRSDGRVRRSLLEALPLLNNNGPIKLVLDQYRGILSPDTLHAVEAALPLSVFTSTLLPDTLLSSAVQASLDSIAASLSGNSITAFAELRQCVETTLDTHTASPQCYSTSYGPASALQTALDNIVEQAAGYLAPNVISSITNNIHYHLASLGDKVSVAKDLLPAFEHIGNVLNSIGASAGGNTATAVLQLQVCINNVIKVGVPNLPESYRCFVDGPVSSLQVILNGVTQQAFGYLPPNLVLDLQQITAPTGSKINEIAYAKALDTVFRASGAGPRLTTCFATLQECMLTAAKSGDKVDCAKKLAAACKAIPETLTS